VIRTINSHVIRRSRSPMRDSPAVIVIDALYSLLALAPTRKRSAGF
jgi:hypothetical protein